MKTRVLFLCTGNSCRSQMAEGFLRARGGDAYEAHSAGTNPSQVNPLAVEVMREIGIDISGQRLRTWRNTSASILRPSLQSVTTRRSTVRSFRAPAFASTGRLRTRRKPLERKQSGACYSARCAMKSALASKIGLQRKHRCKTRLPAGYLDPSVAAWLWAGVGGHFENVEGVIEDCLEWVLEQPTVGGVVLKKCRTDGWR